MNPVDQGLLQLSTKYPSAVRGHILKHWPQVHNPNEVSVTKTHVYSTLSSVFLPASNLNTMV